MSEDDANIERAHQGFAAYNAGDLEAYLSIYRFPLVHVDSNTGARQTVDGASSLAANEAFRAAFPDHRCDVQTIVADRGRVLVRYINQGTYSGQHPAFIEHLGPPTSTTVSWAGMSDYLFEDGLVTEVASFGDMAALRLQLALD